MKGRKNNRYATAYFEACMHMAAELNGGVNLACLKTRIMMINVTAWKLITIVSLRFPIMPQTLLWKLIWIFHKSKRQSCLKAIWHVPSPVYISSGLVEELKIIMPDVALHPEKEPPRWPFCFYSFSSVISLLSENMLGRPECQISCQDVAYAKLVSRRQVLQHSQIYPLLPFVVVLIREKLSLLKITQTEQADEFTTSKWV